MELIEFAQKYCTVIFSGIDDDKIKSLHPFQIEYLKSLQEHRFTHTTKSRQILGFSTMLAIYTAWFLLFFKSKKPGCIGIMSQKREMACEILMKAQVILDSYKLEHPEITQLINNMAKKQLDNKNTAIAMNGSPTSLCSVNVDVLIIDEAAYLDLEEVMKAALPIVAGHGCLHLISSPNGLSYFYKIKMDDNNAYYKQNYHYSLNTSANNRIEELRRLMPKDLWRQDMELEFFNLQPATKPKDKILQFRIDNAMLSQLNERLLNVDLSLSDYIRSLIRKDLNSA